MVGLRDCIFIDVYLPIHRMLRYLVPREQGACPGREQRKPHIRRETQTLLPSQHSERVSS
jgi:hypothetical protein